MLSEMKLYSSVLLIHRLYILLNVQLNYSIFIFTYSIGKIGPKLGD